MEGGGGMKLADIARKLDAAITSNTNEPPTIPEMEEMRDKLAEFAEYCRFRKDSTMCAALHQEASSIQWRIDARKR
jgi:hypothetical protein